MLVATDVRLKDDEIDPRMYEHHVMLMSQSIVYVVRFPMHITVSEAL